MNKSGRIAHWLMRKLRVASPQDNLPSEQYFIPPPNEDISLSTGLANIFRMKIVDYTVWKLQTSYFNYLFVIAIMYFAVINIFAVIMLGIVMNYNDAKYEQCLNKWDYKLNNPRKFLTAFEIAFELSWTTFSTVVSVLATV